MSQAPVQRPADRRPVVDPEVPTPLSAPGVTVVDGPQRVGSELRWRARRADGSAVVVAQLLPELSRDLSLRRRWVRDVRRLAELRIPVLAEILEIGPAPDPASPDAAPPWRVRLDPDGESLENRLGRRAPLPPDEAAELVALIADALHEIHAAGAVLRDVGPRRIVLASGDDDGLRVRLCDVGLTRVDVLSTRTAASLVLEGSAYASPEQIERTAIDQRSDVYGLGVLLYRALTGELPHGDTPAILRASEPPTPPSQIRPRVPPILDALVLRCLQHDPSARPDSAAEVAAILRGERPLPEAALAIQACQSCGATLPAGQRLCLSCGKVAVRHAHLRGGDATRRWEVRLVKVDEQADTIAGLRRRLAALCDGGPPPLNFIVGDQRMYSRRERKEFLRLPVVLFADLDQATAEGVMRRLDGGGLRLEIRETTRVPAAPSRKVLAVASAAVVVTLGMLALVGAPAVALLVVSLVLILGTFGAVFAHARRRSRTPPMPALLRLRPAAAALPASDPWVARLAALLDDRTPKDMRDQIGRLALAVQRLVDHRAENRGEAAEIDAVTEPVGRLVDLIEAQVRRVVEIDRDLAHLHEGRLVRVLARVEARREGEAAMADALEQLDRLRSLEDERARAFHRLLEASSLVRRAIELGLSVADERAEHDRQIRRALLALERP